jgi:hypothetical protein
VSEDLLCLSSVVLMFMGMAVLFYLVYRFTTNVEATDLTEAEYSVVKDAQFVARCRSTGAPRPGGVVLYRKNALSIHRVYGNGLFTRIMTVDDAPRQAWGSAIGPRWAVRERAGFLPFQDISGIFPIDLGVRILRAGRRLESSSEMSGIQIETKDLRTVVLVGEWVQKGLVPALRRAMGRSWHDMYHAREVLTGVLIGHRWSNGKSSHYDWFSYIDYAKHKLIRSGPDYASNRLEGLRADGRDRHALDLKLPRWLLQRFGGPSGQWQSNERRKDGRSVVPSSPGIGYGAAR